jgi:hypothetical protein
MWISGAGTILRWFSGAYLMRSSGHILLSLLPISRWLNRSLISWYYNKDNCHWIVFLQDILKPQSIYLPYLLQIVNKWKNNNNKKRHIYRWVQIMRGVWKQHSGYARLHFCNALLALIFTHYKCKSPVTNLMHSQELILCYFVVYLLKKICKY